MRIELPGSTVINAPAEQVWKVAGHDFAKISEWASNIPESSVAEGAPIPEGAEVGARACTVDGFGQTYEAFTHYDEQAMYMGYSAEASKMPMGIHYVENNWRVKKLGPNQSEIEFRLVMDLHPVLGRIMAPMMRWQIGKLLKQLGEELKYFVEIGEPHPRTVKARQKNGRQAA